MTKQGIYSKNENNHTKWHCQTLCKVKNENAPENVNDKTNVKLKK